MDLDLTPNPTPTKSLDDTEIETPTHTHSKSHYRRHLPPPVAPAYKECMKNHAATIGGHAVDGCGEFMPPPSSALTCAACGCHRNFHRREDAAITPPFLDFRRPSHMLVGLSNAVEHHQEPVTPTAENPGGRKRFRTKFRQDQKEKMHSFSEKLGWKIHKSDEAAVAEFSREVGVPKGVLKVWMHNNKNTFGKKEITNMMINGRAQIDQEIRENSVHNRSHFQNERLHFNDSNNASSSSA